MDVLGKIFLGFDRFELFTQVVEEQDDGILLLRKIE